MLLQNYHSVEVIISFEVLQQCRGILVWGPSSSGRGEVATFPCFSLLQACTNTIFAHFVSIVFANWLQKILLKPPKASKAARTMAKPEEPDYTQRSQKGQRGFYS